MKESICVFALITQRVAQCTALTLYSAKSINHQSTEKKHLRKRVYHCLTSFFYIYYLNVLISAHHIKQLHPGQQNCVIFCTRCQIISRCSHHLQYACLRFVIVLLMLSLTMSLLLSFTVQQMNSSGGMLKVGLRIKPFGSCCCINLERIAETSIVFGPPTFATLDGTKD